MWACVAGELDSRLVDVQIFMEVAPPLVRGLLSAIKDDECHSVQVVNTVQGLHGVHTMYTPCKMYTDVHDVHHVHDVHNMYTTYATYICAHDAHVEHNVHAVQVVHDVQDFHGECHSVACDRPADRQSQLRRRMAIYRRTVASS